VRKTLDLRTDPAAEEFSPLRIVDGRDTIDSTEV
jgi:hypothetical protein